MTSRHTVLVTRKLPKAVEDRLKGDYDVHLNPDDIMYTTDDLIKLSGEAEAILTCNTCLLYTSPSPRDATLSRMPSSA